MLDYGRFVYKSRVWAGYANRAIKRSFSTQQVNKRREILSSRQVPDFPVTPGAVMAVTMVKDEADIIDRVITHLLEQEVDRVIVADNMSSDDTPRFWLSWPVNTRLRWCKITWRPTISQKK